MPPLPLVLPSSTQIGRDGQVSNARLVNGYPEISGEDGKSVFSIYGAPGLTRWDSASYAGAERGLIELTSDALIAFLGNQVVSFDSAGAATDIGNLVGSGRLHLSRNRASPPQISIVTSAGQYYVLQSGVITLNADADLPAPNSTTYIKGKTIFGIADGRFFASDTDNATSISALAFDVADSSSDALVRVFENAGFLYVFGAQSLEIWQADPSLAGQSFPFSPVQQNIEYGLGGTHTVTKFEKALIWVDQNNIVRYGRDGSAERVSTHAVERSIEALTTTQKAAMVGSFHAWQGHETFVLKGANFTWCLDLPLAKKQGFEKAWYMRQSYGLDHWRANSAIQFAGKYILGDETDGKLYYLDPANFTENGADHVLEAWCPHSHRFPQRMVVDAVEVDIVSGVGLNVEGEGIHFESDAYVTMGDVLDQSGSFTVEALVDADAVLTTAQRIVVKDDESTGWALSLGDAGDGSLRFFHRQLNTVITDAAGFPSSGYAHVAAVFDAAADTTTVYINGVQAGQSTGQTNAISGNSAALAIGSNSGATGFSGFISDVRIWSLARTQAQILANMFTDVTSQGGFTGNDTFTKVLLHFDGLDGSTAIADTNFGGSGHTWTAAGNAQIDTAQSKFGGASGLFDGTGDFVSTPDSADFALGSGDWTVDAWFNCVGLTTAGGNIGGQADTGITPATTSFFLGRNATDEMVLRVSDGTTVGTLNGTTKFTNLLNTGWHHVAAVRTGNVLKLFVDGVQEGGDSVFTGSVPNATTTFTVGARSDAGGSIWTGWIDEFRLSVGIARWTANFTPPTAAYEAGLVGYWKLDEQTGTVANDSSPSGFDGTLTGLALWSSQYQADAANPKLMVDFSDNGGKTFTGERTASFGTQGDYGQTIRLNRWGRCTKKGRIWRLRASAAVLKAINSATVWARPTK